MTVFEQINQLGASQTPFFFMIDFEMNQPVVLPAGQIDAEDLLFKVGVHTNFQKVEYPKPSSIQFEKFPLPYERYKKAIDYVIQEEKKGNSYLVNLTFPTQIETNLSLKEIFCLSHAPYRLWYKDEFVVFSPECFVKIIDGKIASYPMKGTIDASIENAAEIILGDQKEAAEHATIVDLIRNDLSLFAEKVTVEKYRYLETIETKDKKLLQVSSKITGVLPDNYTENLGAILETLLPAGSISGAPKKKTVEIIQHAEHEIRGFYTGVFGFFDGKNLNSAVMIRFIEQKNGQLFYRSGGGVTARSEPAKEYQELIDKVYLPFV